MTKSYLKGRPTNWSHNIGVVDIMTNGNFNLMVHTISNGYTTYNGKIIKY